MYLRKLKKYFARCRISYTVVWTPNQEMYVSLPTCSDKKPIYQLIIVDNGLIVIVTNKIVVYNQIEEIKQIKFYDSKGKEIAQ